MAPKVVTYYTVSHTIGGTSRVIVTYQGGGADSIADLSIAEASYIVDLLRNEKPMQYDPDKKQLSTGSVEIVGEAEAA